MAMRMGRWAGLWFAASCVACGGGSTPMSDAASDGGGSQDVATPTDAGATEDVAAEAGVPVINACTSDVYMDMSTGSASDRMIMMTSSGQFDMPCMTIAAGQSVMFMWNLTTYPIAPGVAPSHMSDPAGSAPNPIQMHASGSVYTVPFATAGFYPFYVPGHDADGLMGVIQVQ
jgi:hypothetical protein